MLVSKSSCSGVIETSVAYCINFRSAKVLLNHSSSGKLSANASKNSIVRSVSILDNVSVSKEENHYCTISRATSEA